MTTELVTAHAGTNHVGSEDVGAMQAATLGAGRYAVELGDNLAVSMDDANTVRIGTGGFFLDGRFVRVSEAETVKVANGSQGAYRKDLVTYTYERDPSSGNVETGTWGVLQGTAAAKEADARAPEFEAGNVLDGDLKATVAVAEVDLAGLTPTARLLLPSVASLKSLGDSVSHVEVGNESSISFTPVVDCDVLVVCAASGVWGYGGGTVTLSVDCAALPAASRHVGKFSGGNTESHQIICWSVFRGAKAGETYGFSLSNGEAGMMGDAERTALCMAVHL